MTSNVLQLVRRNLDKFRSPLSHHTIDIALGTSVSLVVRIFGIALSFLFNLLLARSLGSTGTGIFFLGMTALSIAFVIGRIGLDNAVLRHVAACRSKNDWIGVRGVYKKGMLLAVAASVVSGGALYVVSPWLASEIFEIPDLHPVIQCLSFAVLPMSLLAHHVEAIKGLNHVGWATALQGQGGVFTSLLAVGSLVVLGRNVDALDVANIILLCLIVVAAVAFGIWSRMTQDLTNVPSAFPTSKLLRSNVPLYWVSISNLVLIWFPLAFLGVWGSSTDVGIYGIAFRTAAFATVMLQAVASVSAPKFASLFALGQRDDLAKVVQTTSTIVFVSSVPAVAIFMIAPEYVLLMFGQEFRAGGPTVLRLLALGQLVNIGTGLSAYLLMMVGRETELRNILVASAAACLLLSIILVPTWGMIGAALSYTIGVAFANIAQVRLVVRILGINPLPRFKYRVNSSVPR